MPGTGRDAALRMIMKAAGASRLDRMLAPLLSGTGAILMLHRVTDHPPGELGINDGLAVSPAFLDLALKEVRRLGYALVSMDEAVEALQRGAAGRFAAVTLDDGYVDNLRDALPVLESNDAPFTVFVAPALVEGRMALWWEEVDRIVASRNEIQLKSGQSTRMVPARTRDDKRTAAALLFAHLTSEVPEQTQQDLLRSIDPTSGPPVGQHRLMNWEEVGSVARHRLGTIGAHTIHHYALARLGEDEARREMADSRSRIEQRLGVPVRHFAYPYGHALAVGNREVRLAKELGFASAVTTRHGTLQKGHARHLHALPRISLNGRFQEPRYLRTMLSGFTTLAHSRRRLVTL